MTSMSIFLVFVLILAFILLFINLAFASHNPYPEKNNVFECGFTSFLGQNRTQFSISFFIFALLFLLFDLEILLVYPYLVSAYVNETYGLTIILIFLLALTLGFAFELGKKALSIDSRQTTKTNYPPMPHPLADLSLQKKILLFFERLYMAEKKSILRYYRSFVEFAKVLYKKVLYLVNFFVLYFKSIGAAPIKKKIAYYFGVIAEKVKLSNIINGLFITICIAVARYTATLSGLGFWEFLLYGLFSLSCRLTLGIILEDAFGTLGINFNLYEFLFGKNKSYPDSRQYIFRETRTESDPDSESESGSDNEREYFPIYRFDSRPTSLELKRWLSNLDGDKTPVKDKIKELVCNDFGKGIDSKDKLGIEMEELFGSLQVLNQLNHEYPVQENLDRLASHNSASRDAARAYMESYIRNARTILNDNIDVLGELNERRIYYDEAGLGRPWINEENKQFSKYAQNVFRARTHELETEINDLRTREGTLSTSEVSKLYLLQSELQVLNRTLRSSTFLEARTILEEVRNKNRGITSRANEEENVSLMEQINRIRNRDR